MSFIHCHKCDWSQDDFWEWGSYNPIRFFLRYELCRYWFPRYIGFDPYAIPETKIALKLGFIRKVRKPWIDKPGEPVCGNLDGTPHAAFTTETRIFSWYLMFRSARKWVRRMIHQHWWTYKAWRKDVELGRGGCPECGAALCCD